MSNSLIKNDMKINHHGKGYIVQMSLFFVVLKALTLESPTLESPYMIDIVENHTINGINVPKDKLNITHLKNLIWRGINNSENSQRARELKLWKVEGLVEENDKWKSLEQMLREPYIEDDITSRLGGVLLSSTQMFTKVWKEGLPENKIHIIVKPSPATTGKRRIEDLDEESGDEESGTSKKQRQYPTESEEGRDSLMVISPERLKKIIDFVENNKISLLRSPPSSGKSTLGQVLRDHFDNRGFTSIYITLAGISGKEETKNEKLFNKFWKHKVKNTWTEISEFKKVSYIFIDEIQVIYGDNAPFFWGTLKELISSEENSPLRILFLGSYHPTFDPKATPIEFRHTLGLNNLLLEWEEFQHLTNNYTQLHMTQGSELFSVPKCIQKAIFNLTGGHPGICRLILTTFRSHFRTYKGEKTEANMLRYLASSELRNSITGFSRAFFWIAEWKPTKEEVDFIRNILFSYRTKTPFFLDYDSSPMCKSFIKSGILAIVDKNIQFTAPITRIILNHRLFTCPVNLRSPMSPQTSFDEFLLQTIERMSPSKLSTSLGRGSKSSSSGSYLYERGWQMEWYRTATTLVPLDTSVSADVGPVFEQSAGFLDFYINRDLCWGVELTREGNRLLGHAQRFEVGGAYENIPLNDWAIIDFRHHKKRVRGMKENFWYVLYDDDYKRVTIKRRDQEDIVLVLHGDDLLNSYCEK